MDSSTQDKEFGSLLLTDCTSTVNRFSTTSCLQPFLLWWFWRWGLAFCPGWTRLQSSYFTVGWQGCNTTPSFFPSRWGLANFFVCADLEPQSSWFQSPKNLRDRCSPQPQLYLLKWGLIQEWPQTTILWISASQVIRIIGVGHQHLATI
jgi:hypothetical protein